MTEQEEYFKLLDELADLTRRKRAGYSPGDDPYQNFRMTSMFKVPCESCGHATPIPPIFGIMIREMDKMARIASLLADPDNDKVGEALEETEMDAGNYPLLAISMARADRKKKQRVDDGTLTEAQAREFLADETPTQWDEDDTPWEDDDYFYGDNEPWECPNPPSTGFCCGPACEHERCKKPAHIEPVCCTHQYVARCDDPCPNEACQNNPNCPCKFEAC